MLLQPGSHGLRLFAGLLREVGCGIGRRRRRRTAYDLIQDPRSAQHRRSAVAIGSPQQHRALAQQAPAFFFIKRDFAQLLAVDAGDAIVASQPFIQERVVGGQEFQNTAVVRKDTADEGFRFRYEIMPQLVVKSGNNAGSGTT